MAGKLSKLTVRAAAHVYFKTRAATAPHDRFTWLRHIEPKLGHRRVSELTTGDLESWLADLIPDGADRERRRCAHATANRYFNVLRAILNSAFRKDPTRVPTDAAWRRVRGFPKADQPRTRSLSAAEARRLLGALDPELRTLAHAALLTGLRFGELTALQAGDVGKDFVRVRHSKSGRPRTVPLNREGAALSAALSALRAPEVAVFAPISRTQVSRLMRKACTAARIAPPAVFHDLRRSYGSLLLNAGTSADAVQELLGHTDLRTTRRAYAHMADATLKRAVKRLPAFNEDSRA
jgi:integrase